jgi:Na+/H+ antiporter NhaD/arsenite permease-like protein
MPEMTVATVIFLLTYAVIVTERLDRTVVALVGAALMVAFGVLDQEQALRSIDPNTIVLLVGMMIIINILRRTGIFRFAGWATAVALGGDPWRMLVGFALFAAVASAFLDNVTTILLMAPVSMALSEDLGLDPRPFLITQVIASNIGGTATLIGDPPNILIGGATGLDFLAFLANLAPVVVALLALFIPGVWFLFGRNGRLGAPASNTRKALVEIEPAEHIADPRLLWQSLTVLALTIVGFFLHGVLHLEAGTIAMFGAVLLLLVSRVDPHDVLAEVEWGTIFFFIGLFIVVGGVEETGLLERIAEEVVGIVGGNVLVAALGLIWFAGMISAVVDNIPAVVTMIPLTFAMARLLFPELSALSDVDFAAQPAVTPLWWSLALGACLGGNGSLVGASANVVAVGIAERRGDSIGFWGFTRVGFPMMVGSLVVASLYVWLRYFLLG